MCLSQDETGYRHLARVPTVSGARTSLFVPELDRLFLAVRARSRRTGGHLGVPAGPMKGVGGVARSLRRPCLPAGPALRGPIVPFDGTDAAVAETGEMEIELGPVEYLRDGADAHFARSRSQDQLRVHPGWEASLEGEVAHGLSAGNRWDKCG